MSLTPGQLLLAMTKTREPAVSDKPFSEEPDNTLYAMSLKAMEELGDAQRQVREAQKLIDQCQRINNGFISHNKKLMEQRDKLELDLKDARSFGYLSFGTLLLACLLLAVSIHKGWIVIAQ